MSSRKVSPSFTYNCKSVLLKKSQLSWAGRCVFLTEFSAHYFSFMTQQRGKKIFFSVILLDQQPFIATDFGPKFLRKLSDHLRYMQVPHKIIFNRLSIGSRLQENREVGNKKALLKQTVSHNWRGRYGPLTTTLQGFLNLALNNAGH